MPDIGTPTLDQLAVLTAIADTGSFSAAAARLHRGQSVISYTVTNLEAQLGVTLFDRSLRRPVLTPAGRAILEDARRVGLMIDELRARAGALRQGFEAQISLAVDVLFSVPALTCVLRDFAATFPSVSLRLRMEAVGGVTQLVLDGQCILGLTGWPATQPDQLECRPIGAIRLVPVASPTHPLAQLTAVTRATARDHVQLVLTDASRLTEGQDYGVLALKTWRLGDLGAKHALLLAGLGWGNMPEHLVAADLKTGTLKRLEIGGEQTYDYKLHLIHRIDRPPGRAGAWLADKLAGFGVDRSQARGLCPLDARQRQAPWTATM
jgi:DNA-binding transcriptional LysR family regulator